MENKKSVIIAPSILAADFGHLLDDVKKIEGEAELLHLDVMDGHYVPNISFGIPIVQSLRPYTDIIFDVHLMITNPLDYFEAFAKAGADIITFHIETVDDPSGAIQKIHALGKKAGISVHPDTDVRSIFPYLADLEMILIMSVYPGFGGQSFMPSALERIHAVREQLDLIGSEALISVDGGISEQTAPAVIKAGATALVAGSAIFAAANPEEAIRRLKSCAG